MVAAGRVLFAGIEWWVPDWVIYHIPVLLCRPTASLRQPDSWPPGSGSARPAAGHTGIGHLMTSQAMSEDPLLLPPFGR